MARLFTTEALLLLSTLALSACSDDGDDSNGGGNDDGSGYCGSETAALVGGSGVPENPATPIAETPIAGSACNAVEREFAFETAMHTDVPCVEIEYSTNPPCNGMHYGNAWASYVVYDDPVPRGFYVHSLEHGGVAILHDCDDCDDEIAAAETLLDELEDDEFCVTMQGVLTHRTLLMPDPRLETPWAAASWLFTLTADCFEPDVFEAFALSHRGNGLEQVCRSSPADVTEPPP